VVGTLAPMSRLSIDRISNTSDGAWPITEHLDEHLVL